MVVELTLAFGGHSPQLGQEIEAMRLSAWGASLQTPRVRDRFRFDAFDRQGWHRLCRNESGELIGASRYCRVEVGGPVPDAISFAPVLRDIRYPAVFLNRSVVRRDYRGQGLWRRMIAANVESARAMRPREIWAESGGGRIDYLKALGFECICDSADQEVPGSFSLLRRVCRQ